MKQRRQEDQKVKMTDRDMALLRRLNALGFMHVEQIANCWGVDFATAARRVRKLVLAGLLRRVDMALLEAKPLVATRAGCVLTGDTIPPLAGIRLGTYRHDALLVDLAFELERRFSASFETERQIRTHAGRSDAHRPDGVVHLPDGRHAAVELELSQKSQSRLAEIMAFHAGNLAVDMVWYVIINEAMRPGLARAASDYPHIKIVKWTPPLRRAATPATSTIGG